jgi:uncharacterized membrane protein YgdD (TMEM256/DUF423 family)
MSARLTLLIAALAGAVAVMLGAFAAHVLRAQLSAQMLDVFQTGVTYQFYHVLALFGVGLLRQRSDRPALQVSAWLFLIGMLLFCGSLYVLVLTGEHYLGVITPIGGVAMIAGWLTLAWAVFSKVKQHADTGER